ncbi:winged helix-turn-helix domain-containing protein [Salinigranum salinum]
MQGVRSSDAFDMLADETRIRILQELGRARGGDGAEPKTYSDLMEAVSVRDSGRFNYHLTKLRDHFVNQAEDGYVLSYEGVLVYRSIISGTWSGQPPTETFPVGSHCHECSGELLARPDDHILHIVCSDCETTFLAGYLPPRGYSDRSNQAVLDALNDRVRHQMKQITRSVCPWCSGKTNAGVVPVTDTPLHDRPIELAVQHECHQCEAHAWMTIGQRLLDHPAVVSFYYRHGIDLTDRAVWELPFAVTDRCTTVREDDPLRVALAIDRERDHLDIMIDEHAAVTDVTWDWVGGHPSE